MNHHVSGPRPHRPTSIPNSTNKTKAGVRSFKSNSTVWPIPEPVSTRSFTDSNSVFFHMPIIAHDTTQGVSSPSFGHSELRHHGAGHALHLLQVAPGARRDLRGAEDQLLRHTATKGSRNAGLRRRGDVGLGTDPTTWIQLERELDKYGQRMCVTSLFLICLKYLLCLVASLGLLKFSYNEMFCWDFCSAFSMAAEIKLWSSPGVNQVSPFASMTGPTVLVNRGSRTLQIIPKYLDITWTYCFTMFYIVFTVSSAVGKKNWESHRNIKYTKEMWWIYSLNNESTVHHSPPSSTSNLSIPFPRLTTGDHCHLVDSIVMWQQGPHDGVACFVVSNELLGGIVLQNEHGWPGSSSPRYYVIIMC